MGKTQQVKGDEGCWRRLQFYIGSQGKPYWKALYYCYYCILTIFDLIITYVTTCNYITVLFTC